MANQFAALATPSTSGQIEQISPTKVRAALSAGGRCVVIGTYSLWVKNGTVTVCGARFPASSRPYNVFAPISHALPAIEPTDGLAEFELETINNGLQSLLTVGFPDVWRPAGVQTQSTSSFYVLGHDFQADALYKILEVPKSWQSVINGLADALNTSSSPLSSPPRILVNGAASCGTSTFAQNLLNSLISKVGPSVGVAFVDLEAVRPAFTPPGTIALQEVKAPIFGPPFTRPAANVGNLSRMHFVGHRPAEILERGPPWYFACCIELLNYESSKRSSTSKKPLIVHAPKWLSPLTTQNTLYSSAAKQQIWEAINPTHVVHLSASEDPFITSIPELETTAIQHIRQKPFAQYDLTRQAEMSMQAYFHLKFWKDGSRFFTSTPVLNNIEAMYSLSCDEFGGLKGAILDTSIPTDVTIEGLVGRMAAVLLVTEEGLDAAEGTEYRGDDEYWGIPRYSLNDFSPEVVSCLGFGFIRRVDRVDMELVLTTPITKARLFGKDNAKEQPQLLLWLPGGDTTWIERER
jgi:mRNA cleavage and polyadenylation factor CLP1 P-loop